MDEPPSIERPLGPAETILWAADALCPVHFTTFVTVRGPLDAGLLREALDHVQRRHPPLRVRIRRDGDALWFREIAAEIPLSVRQVDEDAIERARAEMCLERVDAALDPLLHATLLVHGPLHSTLLLRFHHTIGDGKSGVFLARDVLETCNRRLRDGTTFVPLPALSPTPSLESLFGLERVSAHALLRHAGAMLDFTLEMARRAPILTLPLLTTTPLPHRSLTVVRHVWSAADTARLSARCRRENTTVHGALLAGLTLAALASAGHGGPRGATLGSPVDIRARGRADVGEAHAHRAVPVPARRLPPSHPHRARSDQRGVLPTRSHPPRRAGGGRAPRKGRGPLRPRAPRRLRSSPRASGLRGRRQRRARPRRRLPRARPGRHLQRCSPHALRQGAAVETPGAVVFSDRLGHGAAPSGRTAGGLRGRLRAHGLLLVSVEVFMEEHDDDVQEWMHEEYPYELDFSDQGVSRGLRIDLDPDDEEDS